LQLLVCINATAQKKNYDTSSNRDQPTLTDIEGNIHKTGLSTGVTTMVFVWLGVECPISQQCTKSVNALAESYKNRGVAFYGVVPGKYYNAKEIRTFKKMYHINFVLLTDTAYTLTNMLGANVTPQAVVTDHNYQIRYTGAIDNSYRELGRKNARVTAQYLADALTAVSHKQPVTIPYTVPVGCLIATKPNKK